MNQWSITCVFDKLCVQSQYWSQIIHSTRFCLKSLGFSLLTVTRMLKSNMEENLLKEQLSVFASFSFFVYFERFFFYICGTNHSSEQRNIQQNHDRWLEFSQKQIKHGFDSYSAQNSLFPDTSLAPLGEHHVSPSVSWICSDKNNSPQRQPVAAGLLGAHMLK